MLPCSGARLIPRGITAGYPYTMWTTLLRVTPAGQYRLSLIIKQARP